MIIKKIVIWCITCFVCLIFGCSLSLSSQDTIEYSFDEKEASDVVVCGSSTPTDSKTLESYCSPSISISENQISSKEEHLYSLSEYYPQWYGNVQFNDTTSFYSTIKEYRDGNGFSETIYHNELIDYDGLFLEVLSFTPNSNDEVIRLSVTMPSAWNNTVKKWFIHDGLFLNFYIDGKHVDAFRQRSITPIDENAFEITYRQCILNEYEISSNSLVIIPYVKEYELFTQCTKNGEIHAAHFSDGDEFIEDSRYANECTERIDSVRHELNFAKCSVAVTTSSKTKPTFLEKLIVNVEDIAYTESLGLFDSDFEYHDDDSLSTRGVIYVRLKDFNDIRIIIDSFHIWNKGMELCFSCYFPHEWTDAECRAVDDLSFYLILGNEMPDTTKPVDEQGLESVKTIWDYPNVKLEEERNYFGKKFWESWDWHERHYVYRISFVSDELIQQFKNDNMLTIIPSILTIDEPVLEEGLIYYDSGTSFYSKAYPKWLPELAINLEITNDLFEDGL